MLNCLIRDERGNSMMVRPFKKDNYNFDEQIKERHRIQRIFLKYYGKPVLVHSTPLKKNFLRILDDKKLILPLDHVIEKKCPYMEKVIGIDNCIYFSLGFPYAVRYKFKYSLIFDLDLLKELKYYSGIPVWSIYKRIVDFIYEENPEYLNNLKSKSKICQEVVERYLYKIQDEKTRVFFDFWRDEKNIFEWVMNYPKQKNIKKIIREVSSEYLVKYPKSIKFSKEQSLSKYNPEILSKKPICLDSKYFLGFYIDGEIPKDVMSVLRERFEGKILFDGKRINLIK
jgi:hypothetical protein